MAPVIGESSATTASYSTRYSNPSLFISRWQEVEEKKLRTLEEEMRTKKNIKKTQKRERKASIIQLNALSLSENNINSPDTKTANDEAVQLGSERKNIRRSFIG